MPAACGHGLAWQARRAAALAEPWDRRRWERWQPPLASRCCSVAATVAAAVIGGGAPPPQMAMPYRDVPPPTTHEQQDTIWLRGLPPLDPANPALQWCEHYSEPVPPIWDTGHAGSALKDLKPCLLSAIPANQEIDRVKAPTKRAH